MDTGISGICNFLSVASSDSSHDTAVTQTDVPWFLNNPKTRRYLVGVSGGADSVALLHLLVRSGYKKLVVCHLNHKLRGKASQGDARFVSRLAEQLGLDYESDSVNVADLAASTGESLETAGRQARHEFFSKASKKWRCNRLLLAHHADDVAETVLWNLLRGSSGAKGIAMRQDMIMSDRKMTIIRPLLEIRRKDLRDWLGSEGFTWREDKTNAEPIAVRNRLRNEVIPHLSDITRRDVVTSLVRAAEADDDLRVIREWAVEEAHAIDPQGRLHIKRLMELPPALRSACIHSYLKNEGVSDLGRKTISSVMAMLEPSGQPRLSLPGGRLMKRRQGRLWVE